MIVTCPNCGARYRLADDVVARGARLKCAACDHRWVPEAEPDTVVAEPVAAPEPEPLADVPPDERADDIAAETADADPPRSTLVRTVVAVVLGAALTIAAAGLWIGRIDPARLPMLAPLLERLAPPASPVSVTVRGTVAVLPSGGRVLEVSGVIANPGTASVAVPPLHASLSGPLVAVRRWTIAPPVARLGPGASVPFASTVTGFPAEATTLAVTPAR